MRIYPKQLKDPKVPDKCVRTSRGPQESTLWVLDIMGPFCPLPRSRDPTRSSVGTRVADQVSRRLGYSVVVNKRGDVVDLDVLVDADRVRLRQRIYKIEKRGVV